MSTKYQNVSRNVYIHEPCFHVRILSWPANARITTENNPKFKRINRTSPERAARRTEVRITNKFINGSSHVGGSPNLMYVKGWCTSDTMVRDTIQRVHTEFVAL